MVLLAARLASTGEEWLAVGPRTSTDEVSLVTTIARGSGAPTETSMNALRKL